MRRPIAFSFSSAARFVSGPIQASVGMSARSAEMRLSINSFIFRFASGVNVRRTYSCPSRLPSDASVARTQRCQRGWISCWPERTRLNANSSFTYAEVSVGAAVSITFQRRNAFQSSSGTSVSMAFTSPRYFGWLTLRLCRFSAPTAAKNRGQSMAGLRPGGPPSS